MKQIPDRMSFTIANIEDISSPKKGRKIVWDLRRPKLCIRITENGAKTFYYVTKIDGKTEWSKLGRFPDMTPEVARTRADVIAGEYGKGRNVAEEKREEKKEWTVGKAWEMYEVYFYDVSLAASQFHKTDLVLQNRLPFF